MSQAVMSRRLLLYVFAPLLLHVGGRPVFCQNDKGVYPHPEVLIRGDDASNYLKAAAKFLTDNPQSTFAPRVALDLLIVATIQNNVTLAHGAKALLTLDYPSSVQGRYLFTTFQKGEDYREFLSKVLEGNLDKLTEAFAKKFYAAFERGLKRFGNTVLDDAGFVLKCSVFAEEVEGRGTREYLLSRLSQVGKYTQPLREMAQIAFDKQKSRPEKVAALHGLRQREPARFFENFLISRMSEDERSSPQITRLEAENLLLQGRLWEAIPLLEKLPPDQAGDQLLFWRAWCQASSGEGEKALALLSQLGQRYPDSPWHKVGDELAAPIRNLDENVEAYAAAILGVVTEMKKGIGAFEAAASYADRTKEYGVYISLVPDDNSIEFHMFEGKTHLFAYKSGEGMSLLFSKTDPVIHQFREPGPIPVPALSLERLEDGAFRFFGGMGLYSSFDGAAAASRGLLTSPFLTTRDGLREFLKRHVQRGSLPLEVAASDGDRVFAWVQPEVDRPQLGRLEYSFSAANKLTSLKFAALTCKQIRYGPRGSFQFNPPRLPEVRVEVQEKLDPAILFKFLGDIVGIFMPAEGQAPQGEAPRIPPPTTGLREESRPTEPELRAKKDYDAKL